MASNTLTMNQTAKSSYYDKKVLLVEKSNLIRLMLKNEFFGVGITNISEASNVDDALNLVRRDNPDVICMSYVYYEIDNKNIFYDIHVINPEAKVLLLSSTPKDELDKEILDRYNIKVFEKNSNFDGLIESIRDF